MNTVSKIFKNISGGINRYFFEDRYSAHSMTILRIGTGLILILQFIVLRDDILSMIQENGIIRQELVVNKQPAYFLSSNAITTFMSDHFHFEELKSLRLLGILYLTTALFLVVGLFTRISALILATLHIAFVVSGYNFSYGVDYFLAIMLFYTVIFPVNREFSIDKYLFRLKETNYTPYVRILQLHICIVYFVSGMSKAIGSHWRDGISIIKALVRPGEAMFSQATGMGNYQWLLIVAGIGTVLTELLYPVFINISKTRRIWLAMTCMMHLSIAIFLNLPMFAATMILFNVAAFSYPVKVRTKTAAPKSSYPLQLA